MIEAAVVSRSQTAFASLGIHSMVGAFVRREQSAKATTNDVNQSSGVITTPRPNPLSPLASLLAERLARPSDLMVVAKVRSDWVVVPMAYNRHRPYVDRLGLRCH